MRNRDWTPIEADYRAGIKSIRAIAREHGVSDTAVKKQADKEGWSRDLANQVRARAAELVRTQSLQSGLHANPVSEQQVVDSEAQVLAAAEVTQRTGTDRALKVVTGMLAELEALELSDDTRKAFARLIHEANPEMSDGERAALFKGLLNAVSLEGRADVGKKLVDAWSKIVDVQRRILKMEAENSGNVNVMDELRRVIQADA